MSKYLEYAKLAFKGLKDIDKIAESVLTQVKLSYGTLSIEEQEEIAKRKLICHNCPLFSLNIKLNGDDEYKKLYNKPFDFKGRDKDRYCGICGCPEDTRTASLSSNCGLEHYNQTHPENIQELKWTEFKPTKQ